MAGLSDVRVCFLDESKNVLIEMKLISLPLKEECIIGKSIEFFADPSPCMIHRSAVMKRLYMEFLGYMEKCKDNGAESAVWEDVPEALRGYLELEAADIKYIVLK
jgi:hypothetical protein